MVDFVPFSALFVFSCWPWLGALPRRRPRALTGASSVRFALTSTFPASVNIAVGAPKPSPEFPAYNALSVTFSQGQQQQTQDFLLSKDGNTLLRLTKLDVSKDPYAELMKKIDMEGRPVRGAKDAKVTIVDYDDFECPFCSRMYATLLQRSFAQLWRQGEAGHERFSFGPKFILGRSALRSNANCLAAQNPDAYWAFPTTSMPTSNVKRRKCFRRCRPPPGPACSNSKTTWTIWQRSRRQKHQLQMAPFKACLQAQSKAAVQASMREGSELGVEATPTLFVNGEKVDGAVPAARIAGDDRSRSARCGRNRARASISAVHACRPMSSAYRGGRPERKFGLSKLNVRRAIECLCRSFPG